jgi:hypothetical protein
MTRFASIDRFGLEATFKELNKKNILQIFMSCGGAAR